MTETPSARILLIADTHLGFDLPFRPRVQKRRRGPDFFANLARALEPALAGEVDLVVHGGDLFYRTRIPAALIDMGLEPLLQVARSGVPVYLVPGNHERSRIPQQLWTTHPQLHIFDRPRTYLCSVGEHRLALAGFPFSRTVRADWQALLAATNHEMVSADARVLCLHQAVEGASVGPAGYTFRRGPDVIPGQALPAGLAAVLSGHIHRAQVLTHDLRGVMLPAPVIYPGAIERTSFAERDETKGYYVLEVGLAGRLRNQLVKQEFVPLPARPMHRVQMNVGRFQGAALLEQIRCELATLDPEAVVRVDLVGNGADEEMARRTLTAAALRQLAPPTMTVELSPGRMAHRRRPGAIDRPRQMD